MAKEQEKVPTEDEPQGAAVKGASGGEPPDAAAPEKPSESTETPESAKASETPTPLEAPPRADSPESSAPTAGREAPGETEEPSVPAREAPEGRHYFWGTGRRKKATARVRIRPGGGKILINSREVDEYFTQDRDRQAVFTPLQTVNMLRSWDVWVNVGGGGFKGQAGAVTLGLARAIAKAMPELESTLRGHGLLTRDARMRERKKYGQKGARKRFQFSKR